MLTDETTKMHTEEFNLHFSDKQKWREQAAPRWVEIMLRDPDRKRAMWALASAELRAEIRRVSSGHR